MLFKSFVLVVFDIYLSNAALFMWSNHEIKISPLEEYTTKDFLNYVEKLQKPDIFIFKSITPISRNIMPFVKGFYSVYSPNGDIEIDKTVDLTGNPEKDLAIIKETIGESYNFISAIIIASNKSRSKRDVDSTEDYTENINIEDKETEQNYEPDTLSVSPSSGISSTYPSLVQPTGPVIYIGMKTTKASERLYALLYSSSPLIFRRNDTEPTDIYLGNVEDDMVIYDTRLNVYVPNGRGNKIILRFNFTWQNGYWYLPSVKITDTQNKAEYNLNAKDEITATEHFSYHCNGETTFSDSNGVELIIYDLQVQTDSRNEKFGDANDCVPFTTAPICSGIFITILLGIGLIIALIAIMDIKTMDKFDNCKTKNLAITVTD